ncbi:MAG: lysine--tRNA ligase [Legionellaceae bacterium]|nr:lysine--tRNA ligase [Legionellaceae bacterium]
MVDVVEELDENEILQNRKKKLADLRETGFDFPNHFKPTDLSADILQSHGCVSSEELAENKVVVSVAGRIVLRRIMGKASFLHIQDVAGRIQVYVRANNVAEKYEEFKHWDLGDIVGITGYLFITKTGELTVHATDILLLTKSLRPLPDKFHGLADQEQRYRKRYVDLIANKDSRDKFLIRSKLIKSFRTFMDNHKFLEVETPMMHTIPGGALARPFVTHHNTLDMEMFLRIAPELYLKRLVVGGFERVYEINRNFRNEGISTRHNPEFTMIEFYQAYANYIDLMDFTEELMHYLCDEVLGSREIDYQGEKIDFSKPFARITIPEAILQFHEDLSENDIATVESCRAVLDRLGFKYKDSDGIGKLQIIIFEETIEHKLIQPTFVMAYPTEVSPLARCSTADPDITDRFELFIAGRELANGFSELNDAEDQADRFKKQVAEKDAGDLEAMHYDHDYIEALEYGMPPTAGEGIGIDRLAMLFTDSASIRDVILFPHLRKE